MPGTSGLDVHEHAIEIAASRGAEGDLAWTLITNRWELPTLSLEQRQQYLTVLPLPLRKTMLFNALHCAQSFDPGRSEPGEGALRRAELVGRSQRLRVLVAEDNVVNRMVTAKILQRAGHTSVLVEDGDQALDMLDEESFDCVLMDVNMPGTSGLDVTKLYRFAHLDGPHLPIIALTADASPVTRKLCEEAGMDGYITKPVDAAHLLESLHACVAGEKIEVDGRQKASEQVRHPRSAR